MAAALHLPNPDIIALAASICPVSLVAVGARPSLATGIIMVKGARMLLENSNALSSFSDWQKFL